MFYINYYSVSNEFGKISIFESFTWRHTSWCQIVLRLRKQIKSIGSFICIAIFELTIIIWGITFVFFNEFESLLHEKNEDLSNASFHFCFLKANNTSGNINFSGVFKKNEWFHAALLRHAIGRRGLFLRGCVSVSWCPCEYDVIMITFDALQMRREAVLLVLNDEIVF